MRPAPQGAAFGTATDQPPHADEPAHRLAFWLEIADTAQALSRRPFARR